MSAESGSGSADTLPSPTVQLTALAENMAIVKAKAKAAAASIVHDNAGAAAVTSPPGPEQPASSSCPHKPSQPVHVASDQPATFAFAKQPTMAGLTPAQRATLKGRAALQTQKHRRYGTGEHEAAILADATPGSILAVSQVAGRAASPDARHEDSGFAHGGREASSGSGRDSSGASGRTVGAPLHTLPPPPVRQSAPPKAQPSSQIAPGPAQYPKMPGPSSTPTTGTAASSGQPLVFNRDTAGVPPYKSTGGFGKEIPDRMRPSDMLVPNWPKQEGQTASDGNYKAPPPRSKLAWPVPHLFPCD